MTSAENADSEYEAMQQQLESWGGCVLAGGSVYRVKL